MMGILTFLPGPDDAKEVQLGGDAQIVPGEQLQQKLCRQMAQCPARCHSRQVFRHQGSNQLCISDIVQGSTGTPRMPHGQAGGERVLGREQGRKGPVEMECNIQHTLQPVSGCFLCQDTPRCFLCPGPSYMEIRRNKFSGHRTHSTMESDGGLNVCDGEMHMHRTMTCSSRKDLRPG